MNHYRIKNRNLMIVSCAESEYLEQIYIRDGEEWALALESAPYATVPRGEDIYYRTLNEPDVSIETASDEITATIRDSRHILVRKLCFDAGHDDLVHISVSFTVKRDMKLCAVEDKLYFMPAVREDEGPESGPLDFVWSQHIKKFETSFIPHYCFKCPVIMMQQGSVFTAIIAGLEKADAEYLKKTPLGFDLQVAGEKHPWMSVGAVTSAPVLPNMPCEAGHSLFVRGTYDSYRTLVLKQGESLEYNYTLMASAQPEKEGYRAVQRYLWVRYGRKGLEESQDMQKCPRFEGIELFDDWRREVWEKDAGSRYFCYEREGVPVGSIAARRQWEKDSRTGSPQDAWFSCWLQELWVGWGLCLYGRNHHQPVWVERAERILDFILTAPRTRGMFPIICYHEKDGSDTWLRDDGWAGYKEEFHTIHMSWTAWLMMRWGRELLPDRMADILEFCGSYADFLINCQHEDGCIPSWFNEEGMPSRLSFRDFNGETAASALFLLEIGDIANHSKWLEAGSRALDFITAKVLPRQRWYDYEAFISCARKPFDFYDSYTSQYPQCNLSTLYAAMAYLRRYESTGNYNDLEYGQKVLDYLLLTQQVWNHPLVEANVFGGFTTQNTDSEWSDVREGICGVPLYWYYRHTGNREYLERAVSAVRAGFPVAPFENWAHWGYDGLQYDSSLLWGTGTIMTGVEILTSQLGDLFVDISAEWGIGVNGCVLNGVRVEGDVLNLYIDPSDAWIGKEMQIRFTNAGRVYLVNVNGRLVGRFSPEELEMGIKWKVI